MTKLIPGAEQIKGGDSDDKKEELFAAFKSGELKKLITKPKIGAWGLNWQHCNHMTYFPSHSFEQWYQSIRRMWRFGQKQNVFVDVVYSDGQSRIFENMLRKEKATAQMFDMLIKSMKDAMELDAQSYQSIKVKLPSWI